MSNFSFKLLAKLITLLHFAWGGWVIGGTLLVVSGFMRSYPALWLVYVVTMFINGIFVFILNYCPLTSFEKKIKAKYNPDHIHKESFSGYWVKKATGKELPSYSIKLLFAAIYVINFLFWLYWR